MANVVDRFYVYEHWRPDKDVCFYVGKGHGDRAWRTTTGKRNRYYRNIAAKLARRGMCVEVRLVASSLNENNALKIEIERIAFWNTKGVKLANLTSGGEGIVGLKHSDATKEIIREKRRRQKISHSIETRAKIGAANSIALKGRKNPEHSARLKGRKLSPEHKSKISAGLMGRIVSDETRDKIRASNTGHKPSPETIQKLRETHIGNRPSAETRAKMTASQLRRWALIKAGK